MNILKYNIYAGVRTDGNPRLLPVEMTWNETNEEIAKKEAYNGEYVIEPDGRLDFVPEPSQLDIIEAQVTYTAMMTDTLLEV